MTPELRRALNEVEALLRAGPSTSDAHPMADAPPVADARRTFDARPASDPSAVLAAAMERLESVLAGVVLVAPDGSRRVARVRAQYALQTRAVPAGTLDGLYDDVRAETAGGGLARAGMSGAFLDAPHALARWRVVATAACLVLAVGAAVFVPGRRDGAPEAQRPLADPRDDLLRRWEPDTADAQADTASGKLSDPVYGSLVPSGHTSRGHTSRGHTSRGHTSRGHASPGRVSADRGPVVDRPFGGRAPGSAAPVGRAVGYERAAAEVPFETPSETPGTTVGRERPQDGRLRWGFSRTDSPRAPFFGGRFDAGRFEGSRTDRRGYFVFHLSASSTSSGRASIQIDETRLLDAFGIRLRLLPPRPRVPSERESN